jgi:conjugal transfer pilus assembly protein TraW
MVAASLACASVTVSGEDLGTIGPTYVIREQSFLEFITKKLQQKQASGELASLEKDAKARGEEAVRHPAPVAGISKSKAARTLYFDPSVVLSSNVTDDKGTVLFPAGTRKNPLEVVSLSKYLLFFDATDAQQVTQAKSLIDSYGGKVKPILVAGSYVDLMKTWQIPVYFDQQGTLTRRLGIDQVPAIVSQEGQLLRIDILKAESSSP